MEREGEGGRVAVAVGWGGGGGATGGKVRGKRGRVSLSAEAVGSVCWTQQRSVSRRSVSQRSVSQRSVSRRSVSQQSVSQRCAMAETCCTCTDVSGGGRAFLSG